MMTFQNNFEAVVIGTSAGGLEALGEILPNLPASFPLPIIIVLHLPTGRMSHIPKVIENKVQLKVKEAVEKENIEAGTIYFAPPSYHLLIEKNKTFSLTIEEPVLFSIPSIDVLFESAADAYGKNLLGILLTGANEDGAMGIKRIKEAGGVALVQNPETAKASVMPAAGMRYVSPDCVLSLEEIAKFLLTMNQTKEKFRIIIVDDVKNNLIALNALLSHDEICITQAHSGDDALNLMLQQDFDLALLDVQMPEMNGIELAELMRGINKTKNIPIIFVTGEDEGQNYKFKGSENGMIDCLQKPLDVELLKSKINAYRVLHQENNAHCQVLL